MASAYHIGGHRYRTLPLVQKVLLAYAAHPLGPEVSSAWSASSFAPHLTPSPEACPNHPRLCTTHLDCSDLFLYLSHQQDLQLLKGMTGSYSSLCHVLFIFVTPTSSWGLTHTKFSVTVGGCTSSGEVRRDWARSTWYPCYGAWP